MSLSDGLDPYFFRRNWKGRGLGRNEWTESCLFHARVGIFFTDDMIEVCFPICTLNMRVNNQVSCQGKGRSRKNESTFGGLHNSVTFGTVINFLKTLTVCF